MAAEMRFFTSTVQEVGRLVAKEGNLWSGDIVDYPGGRLDLRVFWRELVEHHYFICRNVIQLNDGIKLTATASNQVLCFIMCLYLLYYCMESTDLFIKLKSFTLLFCATVVIFAYDATGQILINEGERMRDALADWDWVQSPLWLQKSLLLVLTRTNRPFQVKPFGIFCLDFRNFAAVTQSAYSYFNLLQSVSKK